MTHIWISTRSRRAPLTGWTRRTTSLIDRGVRKLVYNYDMGDDWRHTITVETVGHGEPDVKYPRFIDDERHCPPEDVGLARV